MVLQDTWLFGGTIEENIAYSREYAIKEEIIEASKAARAERFLTVIIRCWMMKPLIFRSGNGSY